ncbi:MAG: septum formation initiator family protein [Ferruginibacter sp.]|nr:septum formation initiator family protein [Ferruginibacter sp.]
MNIKTFKHIFGYLKNKYIITILAFIVWMLFFDPKDVGLMIDRNSKLKNLKISEQHLLSEIKETKKELLLLKTDAASIEKYARERFYMKKDNEELFIYKN